MLWPCIVVPIPWPHPYGGCRAGLTCCWVNLYLLSFFGGPLLYIDPCFKDWPSLGGAVPFTGSFHPCPGQLSLLHLRSVLWGQHRQLHGSLAVQATVSCLKGDPFSAAAGCSRIVGHTVGEVPFGLNVLLLLKPLGYCQITILVSCFFTSSAQCHFLPFTFFPFGILGGRGTREVVCG